jgi:hypothetical protein
MAKNKNYKNEFIISKTIIETRKGIIVIENWVNKNNELRDELKIYYQAKNSDKLESIIEK